MRYRRPFVTVTCAIVLCTAACDAAPSTGDDSRVSVVDSAGVRLVHNLDAAADTAALELVEELRIGVLDGAEEYQFFRVTGVVTDADGRIFVADAGDHAVRIYGADGRFVRGFGRPGEGPGEFTFPAGLFLRNDTVHIAERGGRAGSSVLFDTAGTLLATFGQMLPNGSMVTPIAAGPDGWLAGLRRLAVLAPGSRRGRHHDAVAYVHRACAASSADARDEFPCRR